MVQKRVAIIADTLTSTLFRFLGASTYPADDLKAARESLREIAVRRDVGVLFISTEIFDALRDEISALQRSNPDLIIAKLPTIRERGRPMDVQKELLRALGMG